MPKHLHNPSGGSHRFEGPTFVMPYHSHAEVAVDDSGVRITE
jgi:hypothetical protein